MPALRTSSAGATPNATRSAIESNSAPKLDVALRTLAATPSIVSSKPHQTIIHAASSRYSSPPSCVVTMDAIPSSRLDAVKLFGIV